MKYTYDFHIHTALSPCGHDEMSPHNIVNMAKLLNLDVIAITDHNTCENVQSVMDVAKEEGILVVPAMEIETREEIHVVCFFSSLDDVYNMQNVIYDNLPDIINPVKIFGEQLIFDSNDEVVSKNTRFLSTAANISIDQVFKICGELGGVAIPAHIDRPSYSIISNLGLIPENLGATTLEISKYAEDISYYRQHYSPMKIIQSSDAHDLESMVFNHDTIELSELSLKGIVEYFKKIN